MGLLVMISAFCAGFLLGRASTPEQDDTVKALYDRRLAEKAAKR